MYKYTYLLSQSYRNDASTIAQNYQSRQNLKMISQACLPLSTANYKKISQSQSKPIPYVSSNGETNKHIRNKDKMHVKNIQIIDKLKNGTNYQTIQPILTQDYPNQSTESKMKVKQISDKYRHQTLTSSYQNNNYQSYKENRKKLDTQLQGKFIEISNKDVRKMNEFNGSYHLQNQKPLEQVKRNFEMIDQGQYSVNRARIKSQIAEHLQKSKQKKENVDGAVPKKYNYAIEMQKSPIPAKDKEKDTQSSTTVAKLTSLQQRIKSTVQPYIHF